MSEKSSSPSLPPLQVPEDLETIYVNLVRIAHSPSYRERHRRGFSHGW